MADFRWRQHRSRRQFLARFLEPAEPQQQVEETLLQGVPFLNRPFLVAVFWKQFTIVELDGCVVCGWVGGRSRRLRRDRERFDINPDWHIWMEGKDTLTQTKNRLLRREGQRRCQRPAGGVERLMQIVVGGFWRQIRPEPIDQHLAVNLAAGREHEKFDNRTSF